MAVPDSITWRWCSGAMDPQTELRTYDSFAAADEATRREYWLMSTEQRLGILEQLRMQAYPNGQTAPDFKEFLSLLHTHRVKLRTPLAKRTSMQGEANLASPG